MNNRSPIAVFFLTLVTLGIYGIVWFVKTKDEMNELGAEIPTFWLNLIPFVGIWWMWKYAEGVEQEGIDVRDLLHQLAHGHARAVSR